MAKKKQKKSKHPSANIAQLSGKTTLQNFTQAVFKERASQFQKKGSGIDSVYEGLDFDGIRIKRRISSVLCVAEEVTTRYSDICPDTPNVFSLAEDWVIMNSLPVSAFDQIEKYVFSTLGAAIWLLDHIRDCGKMDKLSEILRNAPLPGDVPMPDVWDPCHSQQLLKRMVSIINNRNSDCSVTEKAIRRNKASVVRVYMDRPTAENKIDHNVPSRRLFDQIMSLVDPEALSSIENTYTEKYWEWLRRYCLCRAIFNREEQAVRAEIDDFKDCLQAMATQTAMLSQTRKHGSILSNASSAGCNAALDMKPDPDQLVQAKALEYQNRMLYDKQEEFNKRFSAFTREVSEFSVLPNEYITKQYGEEIGNIWNGFEMDEPYSMCMAFLSLLDRGSDLPWCYFPSVMLQSCYVSMLPWTRTRFLASCDDIWEHYDAEAEAVVPGPSALPLSKKIKVPDLDNWYRLQYHDTAKSQSNGKDLFSLSHILYEVTGCLMPRKPERHLASLSTLNRYGINSKKANQNLLYCMALLGEAKHQSLLSQFPVLQETASENIPDTADELREQVLALKEELSTYKQALQEATSCNSVVASRMAQLQHQLVHRDLLLHDLSSIIFDAKMPIAPKGTGFPCRTASYFAVFSADDTWLKRMDAMLPDVLFLHGLPKGNTEILRTADTIWIQPKNMSYEEYRGIIAEAGKADIPVRIFPFTDVTSCAALLVQADISR